MELIDFVQTKYNDFWQMLGQGYNARADKYTPYNRAKLSWDSYDAIRNNTADIKAAVGLWRSNVGDNGWQIHCSKSNSTRKNEKLSGQIETLLKQAGVESHILKYVNLVGTQGNAIYTVDDNNKPILRSIRYYNLYYDSINERPLRYAMLVNGVEQRGEPGNLAQGEHLWHLKDPATANEPLAIPRIDACYEQILAYLHIWQANNHKWSKGLVDPQLAIMEMEYKEYFEQKDNDGKTNFQLWAERIKDWFGGSSKAGELLMIPGLKDIRNPTTSPREMLGDLFLDKARQTIAVAFDLAPEDLGLGQKTYNNVQNYNYALGDKIGRPLEQGFADSINNWLLPKIFGIDTDETLYFKFNPPKDPDEREDQKVFLDAYTRSLQGGQPAFTVNELREKYGFGEAPQELLDLTQANQAAAQAQSINTIDGQANAPKKEIVANSYAAKFSEPQKKTAVEVALGSNQFESASVDENGKNTSTGFKPKLEKAILSQLKALVKNIANKDLNQIDLAKDLPKLETFYSFPAFKKDLLNFAKFGVDEFKSNNQKIANFEFPSVILELIDVKTQALLQGTDSLNGEQKQYLPDYFENYQGLDAETSAQVNSIITENISDGIDKVVEALTSAIPQLAGNRASIIAHTEVVNAVEDSRYYLYKGEDYKFERWLNVQDEGVCPICEDRTSQGVVEIGTLEYPAHPFDRCSKIYGKTEDEIS